jgi:hypothetical protein
MATITQIDPVKWSLHGKAVRLDHGGSLLLKAIVTDLQFWIPVVVLILGIVLLTLLR